jgi:hypothetical protein
MSYILKGFMGIYQQRYPALKPFPSGHSFSGRDPDGGKRGNCTDQDKKLLEDFRFEKWTR